jgi:hypothetical protein
MRARPAATEAEEALLEDLRLPKQLQNEPVAANLVRELEARARPLRADGELRAAQVEISPALEAALHAAFSAGRIVRGFEGAERILAAEEKGLKHVDRTSGVARGRRVSRLLVLADDGSERFYREVEFLLRRHAPRVLALRLSLDERGLGQLIFGPDHVARLLLVEHKDAVSAVLLALAFDWSEEQDAPS